MVDKKQTLQNKNQSKQKKTNQDKNKTKDLLKRVCVRNTLVSFYL